MPLRYRAVVFDLDGTLVDSYEALAAAVNHACAPHGCKSFDAAEIRAFVGDGVEKLLERVFDPAAVPDGVMDRFTRRYDDLCCEGSRVLEDVRETLAQLQTLGVAMAVCTNKPTSFSTKILAHLALEPFFRAVVGPDVARARKPDRAHVLHALAATHCAAREALFVGDMPVDIHAARNSGIDVAVIATGSSSAADLVAAAPDHVLSRFSDLVGVVAA